MAAETIDICRDKTYQLVGSIEKTVQLMSIPGYVLFSYYGLLKLLYHSKKTMGYYRKHVFTCTKDCSVPKECVVFTCEKSVNIRNSLFELNEKSKLTPLLRPQSLIYQYLLGEWDDLVEDCTITSDPEVNNLLSQIADAA